MDRSGGMPVAWRIPRCAALGRVSAVARSSLPAVAAVLAACAGVACQTAPKRPEPMEVLLPTWLTAPKGLEQRSAPVMLGTQLPPELAQVGKRFVGLPPWYVYGAVRCLGADEFLAAGVVCTHVLNDGRAEYRCVSDSLCYNVDSQRVEEALSGAAKEVAEVRDADRDKVLRAKIIRYDSGFALFSLAGDDGPKGDSGQERFRAGDSVPGSPLGWSETADEYRVTQVGDFAYVDPLGSLRKVEEDAIGELARGTIVQVAHLHKSVTGAARDTQEDTTRETIRVRIRGLRVLRRTIDLSDGSCRVTIAVAKGSVERVK